MPDLRKIMIVDDSTDIQMLLTVTLEKFAGYEVLCCDSGPDALARGPAFQPDLAILDIMMPVMSGPELHAEMGKDPVLSTVPVIYLSAANQAAETYRDQPGVLEVFIKPFDPIGLKGQLEAAWTRHQL